VSHLPQIAAMADHQYLVEKKVKQGRTITTLRELTKEQRIDAVASLLGMQDAGEESGRVHAANMVEAAQTRKRK